MLVIQYLLHTGTCTSWCTDITTGSSWQTCTCMSCMQWRGLWVEKFTKCGWNYAYIGTCKVYYLIDMYGYTPSDIFVTEIYYLFWSFFKDPCQNAEI